jgi:hypothetical protein
LPADLTTKSRVSQEFLKTPRRLAIIHTRGCDRGTQEDAMNYRIVLVLTLAACLAASPGRADVSVE